MKYSIEGFSQKRLIENNLGLKDSYILRWLVDFSKSGKMVTLNINRMTTVKTRECLLSLQLETVR